MATPPVQGILLWLPLQRLLQAGLLTSALIRLRLPLVNQLSLEEFAAFQRDLPSGDSEDAHYVRLCTYQGELSQAALLIFRPEDLLYRALLLGDYRWYEGAIGLVDPRMFAENDWILQNALESAQPRLQALTLAQYVLYRRSQDVSFDLEALRDLESIPWTPGLYRYLAAQAREYARADWIARFPYGFGIGFFQVYNLPEILAHFPDEVLYDRSGLPPADNIPTLGGFSPKTWLNILRGWLTFELSKPENVAPPVFPELSGKFFLNPYLRRSIFAAGYVLPVGWGYETEMMAVALAELRPRAFRELLRRQVALPARPTLDYSASIISRSRLERAQQVLSLCPPETNVAYLTDLRAVLGGEIGPHLDEDRFIEALATANPNLWDRADFQALVRPGNYDVPYILNNSNVKYDLGGGAGKIPVSQQNFWQLLAYGQFYRFQQLTPGGLPKWSAAAGESPAREVLQREAATIEAQLRS